MRKSLLIVVVLWGCASTKITEYTSPPNLLKSDNIMVAPILGVSDKVSYDLFKITKDHIKTVQNNVMYIPEEEYSMLSAGVSKEVLYNFEYLDSLKSYLGSNYGIDYLLIVEVLGLTSKKGSYSYYTDNELNRYNRAYNQSDQTNKVELLYSVLNTKSKTLDSKFVVKTQINPMTFNENGGESRVNITNAHSALVLAYEKGIKKLKKGFKVN